MNGYLEMQADLTRHDPEWQAADMERRLETGIRNRPERYVDVVREAETGRLMSVSDADTGYLWVRLSEGWGWTS